MKNFDFKLMHSLVSGTRQAGPGKSYGQVPWVPNRHWTITCLFCWYILKRHYACSSAFLLALKTDTQNYQNAFNYTVEDNLKFHMGNLVACKWDGPSHKNHHAPCTHPYIHPCTIPCTIPYADPCMAQLARQPQPQSRPSGTIRTGTALDDSQYAAICYNLKH